MPYNGGIIGPKKQITNLAASGLWSMREHERQSRDRVWPYEIVKSNLVLLLDAGNTSSYPGTGTTWFDISGNSNNFSIVAGAWVSNAQRSYMNFGGSFGCAKNAANISLSGDVTILAVTRILNSTADWRTLMRGYGGDHQVIVQSGGWAVGMYDNDSNQFISTGYSQQSLPGYSTGSFDIMCWRYTNNDNPTYDFNVNNVQRGTITNSNARFTRGFGAIGAYHNENTTPSSGVQYWGDIAMFAAYNRRLTDTELAENFIALRGRYGL